jgi:Zn-dependent M16 (insulinase) family peptidase
MNEIPETGLRAGKTLHNFTIERIRPLQLQSCLAIEAVHGPTGAKLLHLLADDDENLFAISFKTPPPDDTGIPHILEHSVLGGSEKYPVKDPFVELLKMSMATFINAMTYDDRTVYPVSSNVRKDFFNLMDVYCDAVLHPRITRETLMQEGHHLAFLNPDDPESPLTIKGIVYNEMKGAYSSPDSLMMRTAARLLFPDSPYGRDAGGDPEHIPELTYEQFVDFYKTLYHPANARIFLYGDIPTEEHLVFLDERLSGCPPPPSEIPNGIPIQPRWDAPREHVEAFSVDDSDDLETKASVSLHWALGAFTDPLRDVAWEVLDRLLLGNSAAPLYKALLRSGLGRDLVSSGYGNESLEKVFDIGLKGTSVTKKDEIVELVLKTLAEIAADGFDEERMAIAFHQLQYGHREIQSHYPLRLMDWAYESWNYDLDPLTYFMTPMHLDELQNMVRENPDYFADMIRDEILENPHRLTLVMKPDPAVDDDRAAAFQKRMQELKNNMSPEQLDDVRQLDAALEALQSQPNSPEDLATLPQLNMEDIPQTPREFPYAVIRPAAGYELVRPEIHTNGIEYTEVSFDLAGLDSDLWLYVPVFSSLLPRLGTSRHSYEEMAQRLAGSTGGFMANALATTTVRGMDDLKARFEFKFKALESTCSGAVDIVSELVQDADFTDRERVRELLSQLLERQHAMLIPSGHSMAALQAGRALSPMAALDALWNGICQLRLTHELVTHFDRRFDELMEKMRGIARFLSTRSTPLVAFTGADGNLERVQTWVDKTFTGAGVEISGAPALPDFSGDCPPVAEGLVLAADVSYCAACMKAPHYTDPEAPEMALAAHMLGLGYFWDNIRVKGGAYGGSCLFDGASGLLKFFSYRDPNIENSLAVFDRVAEFMRDVSMSEDDLDKAKIGVLRNDEAPVRPGAGTHKALVWHLTGMDQKLREQKRKELLACRPEQVRQTALSVLDAGREHMRTCVLGSRGNLENANSKAGAGLKLENIFPDDARGARARRRRDTSSAGFQPAAPGG